MSTPLRILPIIAILLLLASLAYAPPRSAGATVPSGIIYSIPITIKNSQSSATSAPFQQNVTISNSAYSSHEAANLQNVEFFDENGAVVPSWLESGKCDVTYQ